MSSISSHNNQDRIESGSRGSRNHPKPHSYQKNYEGRPLLHDSNNNKYPIHNDDNDSFGGDNESEAGRQEACRGITVTAFLLFALLVTFRYFTASWFFGEQTSSNNSPISSSLSDNQHCPDKIPFCRRDEAQKYVVEVGRKGFPSFWDYASKGRIKVGYDGRSFRLNGDRVLFLSGSMHPARATKQTWEHALDEAVRNGLNMITIYVFWAAHQPFPDQPFPDEKMDWTLPAGRSMACQAANEKPSYCGWSLADSIRAAAKRGLFIHARIGPYVCAEYSYGGIPEWVALHEPEMRMRRLNKKWMTAMEKYVKSTVDYLSENQLFAHQGGPIVMAQIENELGEEDDDNNIPIVDDDMPPVEESDSDGVRALHSKRSKVAKEATVQDYADWCGSLVAMLSPKVVWTMCNGLSANSTITTCNGDCSTKWLEDHGPSGRIQVDQPAMWTEDEGGFQIWGDDANNPSDYFWGRTARDMSYDTLRWFARGGTHLNYYMFWGGYNRGRASASGIMNAYATDAPVCPSGQPRQPKFDHFAALHQVLHRVAPILLEAPTALNRGIDIEHMNESGQWEISGKQRMFVYRTNHTRNDDKEVAFVENDSKSPVIVKLALGAAIMSETLIVEMNPMSAMLIKDGAIKYDSFIVKKAAMAYERDTHPSSTKLFGWSSCAEIVGVVSDRTAAIEDSKPIEQTALNIGATVSSDYAWFETDFVLNSAMDNGTLSIGTQKGGAMVLFIDGVFQGEVSNHEHAEADEIFLFGINAIESGNHTLALLSESFGYHNLIGRWGARTTTKVKGITGNVWLTLQGRNQSLVSRDTTWRSSPGLNGGVKGYCREVNASPSTWAHPKWSTAMFNTPAYDPTTHALYLNITKGRGHLWLNSHNLGRFWNVTRGDTDKFSQQYYFLPHDFLDSNGSVNKIVFFDAFGADLSTTNLVLSWLKKADTPTFKDEVDFPLACV